MQCLAHSTHSIKLSKFKSSLSFPILSSHKNHQGPLQTFFQLHSYLLNQYTRDNLRNLFNKSSLNQSPDQLSFNTIKALTKLNDYLKQLQTSQKQSICSRLIAFTCFTSHICTYSELICIYARSLHLIYINYSPWLIIINSMLL